MALDLRREAGGVELKTNTNETKVLSLSGHGILPDWTRGRPLITLYSLEE